METQGYTYIVTNYTNSVLYTGVTDDLIRRISEHKEGRGSHFTSKYHCNKLVYFEHYPDIEQAIRREKQIKSYPRKWKENLINGLNKEWKDLGLTLLHNPDL